VRGQPIVLRRVRLDRATWRAQPSAAGRDHGPGKLPALLRPGEV